MATPNSDTGPSAGNGATHAGFAWAGDLADVGVHSLYAACHALRFSGRLELRDDNHQAKIIFLGGDPIEIHGGNTQAISVWGTGKFHAIQGLPSLAGDLTDHLEQTGSLAITQANRLLAWVSEYRLTCELAIERPGEQASLAFKNGQLESATVNGKPELAALARVQAWTDGFYRVSLRPLFAGDMIALSPPPMEGATPGTRQFDLSRSIPLDLKTKAQLVPPEMLRVGGTDNSIAAERELVRKKHADASAPPSHGTDPVQPIAQRPPPPMSTPRNSWPIVVISGLLVAGAIVLGALYHLHMPPFSPRPSMSFDRDKGVKTEPAVDPAKHVLLPKHLPKSDHPAAVPVPVAAAKTDVAATPGKPVDPAQLEPKSDRPSTLPAVEAEPDQRLIEKGRLLLMEGHPHSAISLYRKAEQVNPKNTLAGTLEQQALGKLGHADITVEGKGHVMVDGKHIESPKKLKLFAGPHAIDAGEGVEEVVLKKGEHKKLRAHP